MGVELRNTLNEDDVDLNFSDSDLVYHVRDALLSVSSGDNQNYNQLVGVLHRNDRLSPDEVALLVTSLKALTGAVSYIHNTHHSSLFNSIFAMSFWNYGPDVMDALVDLVISMAASNGIYLDSCLEMLVSNFMPPNYLLDVIKQPRGLMKKEQVLSRVHSALKHITDLVPLSASRLSSIVVHRIPFSIKKERFKDRMQVYVENMLRLESGDIGEFIGSRMIMALLDTLVELDVSIGWDEILRDDPLKGIFAIELNDDVSDDGDGDDDDEELGDGELPLMLSRRILRKNVVADLLDELMVQTFEHLDLCATNNRLNEVFATLMDSFQITVMNTYKSKFAQFVMFYICALDPEYCGKKFGMTLWDKFVFGDNPLTRMSAVAYLASYLARAKFLSDMFVASVIERLIDWCVEYCEVYNNDMSRKAHRVFYSGCQAILYVLCFRMRSMVNATRLKSKLLFILNHELKPLKVCLPSVVEEFCKQAKAARLLTISASDFMESDLSRDFGGAERLDTFFPFDPCLLKRCDRSFIRPYFVYWKHVRPTYDDGDDDEDSSDEEFEVEDGQNFMAMSLDDLDEFQYTMNKMSITPKNNSSFRMRMPSRIRPSMSPESL